jgi:ABC-type antimicrobial peptide transport system permease subunit
VGNNYYTHVKFNNPQDSIRAWYNKVDENYISLFDLKFLAGQNFTSHLETETEVIVNEELIRRLNIGSGIPVNAIGEFVQIEGKNLRIVGVLTNFHFSTLENAIGPFIFRNTGTSFNYINVKLSSNHFHEALQEIELMWKKTGSVHPFEAYFYDDLIQRAYSEYSAMVKVIGYLAVLTVIIASLGLIGMVVYSTDARLAEVSIRKVFGAQVKQLMFMLGSGFVTLLFLSAAIAIPITYFVFERMVLRNVTYHSPIGFFELAIGGFVMMLIALILICSYTLKVANTNPADVLKNE